MPRIVVNNADTICIENEPPQDARYIEMILINPIMVQNLLPIVHFYSLFFLKILAWISGNKDMVMAVKH